MGIVSFRGAEKVYIANKKLADRLNFYRKTYFGAGFADLPAGGLKKSV